MSKRGRPVSKNPRTNGYRLRMTKEERQLLDDTRAMTGMSIADTIRFALEKLYKEEKFKAECPLSPLHDKRYKKEE